MHLYVYNLISNVSHFIFITNHFLINKNMCYDQIKKVTFTQCLFFHVGLDSFSYIAVSPATSTGVTNSSHSAINITLNTEGTERYILILI